MTETADNEIKLNFEGKNESVGDYLSVNEAADGIQSENKSSFKEHSQQSVSKQVPAVAIDEMTSEELVVHVANQIDKNITALDEKLDSVLERHEKEFLTAYRFHMLKVQGELTALKQKANERQLKLKQDSRMMTLEKDMVRYRTDCMNIMKYCNMQKQLVTDFSGQVVERLEDRDFLDTELAQTKVDNIKLKLALTQIHDTNEQRAVQNLKAQGELNEIRVATHQVTEDQLASTFQDITKEGWIQDPVESSLEGEADGGSPNTHMQEGFADQSLMVSNYKNRSLENDYHQQAQGQSLDISKPPGLFQSSIAEKQTQNTSNIKGTHADQSLVMPTIEGSLQMPEPSITEINSHSIIHPHQRAFVNQQSNQDALNQSRELMNRSHIDEENSLQSQQDHTYLQEKYFQEEAENVKRLKFMPTFKKGFTNGAGPSDFFSSKTYNQKLEKLIDETYFNSVDEEDNSAQVPPVNTLPQETEQFFRDQLQRRFDLIEKVKGQIAIEQMKNKVKRRMLDERKANIEQRKLSKTLVSSFKECIHKVLSEKEKRKQVCNPQKFIKLHNSDLQSTDKRQILENFVENDEALGQLLDFISNMYIQPQQKDLSSTSAINEIPNSANASFNGSNMPSRQNISFMMNQPGNLAGNLAGNLGVDSPHLSGHSQHKFASTNQVRSGRDGKGLSGSIGIVSSGAGKSGIKISPGMMQSHGSATRTGQNQTQFRTDNVYTHSGPMSGINVPGAIQQERSNFRISRESDIGTESALEQKHNFNTSQPSPTRTFATKKESDKQKQVPITQFPTQFTSQPAQKSKTPFQVEGSKTATQVSTAQGNHPSGLSPVMIQGQKVGPTTIFDNEMSSKGQITSTSRRNVLANIASLDVQKEQSETKQTQMLDPEERAIIDIKMQRTQIK